MQKHKKSFSVEKGVSAEKGEMSPKAVNRRVMQSKKVKYKKALFSKVEQLIGKVHFILEIVMTTMGFFHIWIMWENIKHH